MHLGGARRTQLGRSHGRAPRTGIVLAAGSSHELDLANNATVATLDDREFAEPDALGEAAAEGTARD